MSAVAPVDPTPTNGVGQWRRGALKWAAILAATGAGYAFLAHLADADRLGLRTLGSISSPIHALIAGGRFTAGLVESNPRGLQLFLLAAAVGTAVFRVRVRRSRWRRELSTVLPLTLVLLSAVALASQDLVGGVAASGAAAVMLLLGPEVESRAQTKRASTRLLLLLVLVLGAAMRFWALAEFPPGYAEHAAVHHGKLSIPYAENLSLSLHTVQPSALFEIGRSLVEEQFGVGCLVTAIGFQLFGVSMGVSRLISAALGTFTLLLAFAFGRRVRDDRLGVGFAFLLAVAPWHLSISRYGDTEHVLCPLLALATVVVLIDALRRSRWRDFVLGGVVLGLSWYLYAPTQVVVLIAGLAVLGTIVARPAFFRQNAPKFAVGLALFTLVSYPTLRSFIAQERPLPVRSGYEDGQGLSFLAPVRVAEMAREEFRELFTQVDDAWFTKPGGGLGVTETALLLPGLALCLATLRRRRRGETLLLLGALPITLLPGVFAPDPSFRRLLLAATVILFLAALVVWDFAGRLRPVGPPRALVTAGVVLFAAGYAAVNAHIYFDLSHLWESESHQDDSEMARVVAGVLGVHRVMIVVGDAADVADQESYLSLTAYDKLAALEAQGWSPAHLYRIVTAPEAPAALDDLREFKGSALVFATQFLLGKPPEGFDLPALISDRFPAAHPTVTRAPDGPALFMAWAIDVKQ